MIHQNPKENEIYPAFLSISQSWSFDTSKVISEINQNFQRD